MKKIKQSRNFALRLGVLDDKSAWVMANPQQQNFTFFSSSLFIQRFPNK